MTFADTGRAKRNVTDDEYGALLRTRNKEI
jgi:hypothetical protein